MHENIIHVPEDETISEYPNGLGCMLYENMQKFKHKVAQIDVLNGQSDTYGNFLARCINTALELKSRGITREDIVTLNTNNHLDSSVPFIAAQFLGCKVASIDPSFSVEDARYLLEQVNPFIIFTIASAEKVTREAINNLPRKPEVVVFGSDSFESFISPKIEADKFQPVKVDPTETAAIMFSSGTTGMPKGICCTHLLLVNTGKYLLQTINTDVILIYSTLFWISNVIFLSECCRNGNIRLLAQKFDPTEFWYIAEKYKVTTFFCAPPQVIKIIQNKPNRSFDLKNLCVALVGGGPIPVSYINQMEIMYPHMKLMQVWGQTELGIVTKFMCTTQDFELLRKYPSSCGTLMPGHSAKIVDPETNKILGVNEIGEIRIKSKYQMNGYHNHDSKDRWDAEGFVCTGDVGYYNESNCFFIVDRLKEMLKYQSWHVTPVKIETVLLKHQLVAEAVVIGIPDDIDGDHALALVVLKKDQTISIAEDDLRRYADEQLDDNHKLRGGVIFINKLLYTSTGKFKRTEMRSHILKGIRHF